MKREDGREGVVEEQTISVGEGEEENKGPDVHSNGRSRDRGGADGFLLVANAVLALWMHTGMTQVACEPRQVWRVRAQSASSAGKLVRVVWEF